MAQNTNLNASPYFDDYNSSKNYHRVLFKPGIPIQARELTTLQSILQDQVEKFGKHFFKEGSVVIPGQSAYDDDYFYVRIDASHLGIPVAAYISLLVGKYIKGETSGVKAIIENYITDSESEIGVYTLYVKYQGSSETDFGSSEFVDGENLILLEDLDYGLSTIRENSTFATCLISNATGTGSAAKIETGVFFIRGFFVEVPAQTIILDQYSSTPSYRIGLFVNETVEVASQNNPDLYDNARGFSNFAAPGADRLKISTELIKKSLDDFNDENFIELIRVENGVIQKFVKDTNYNLIRDELARRTYDESGDYYIIPFKSVAKECLNDNSGNNGVYFENQITKSGNIPSDDLLTLQIAPGKAYVRGYEIETLDTTSLDVSKPRTTEYSKNENIPFTLGKQLEVNNVYGSVPVGFGSTSIVSFYSNRTSSPGSASGIPIGVGRVYDFKLKNAEYQNDATKFQVSLYDVQTYNYLQLNSTITLSTPAFIEGSNSGASGYLVDSVSNKSQLVLYQVNGTFSQNESIKINGEQNSRIITSVRDYDVSDIHQIVGTSGVSFTADPILSKFSYLSTPGASFTITTGSGGVSTVTSANNTFVVGIKTGDIVAYAKPSDTLVSYNRVKSVSTTGNSITVEATTSVSNVSNGSLPSSTLTVTNLYKATTDIINNNQAYLYSKLQYNNVSNIDFTGSDIVIRRTYPITVSSGTYSNALESDSSYSLEPFDEEDYTLTFTSSGNVESLNDQKLSVSGNTINLTNISENGSALLTVTFKKENVKSRNKVFSKCSTLIVDKSSKTSSGIGSTTLGDGLTYNAYYGTRVQDTDISLNVPDVANVYAIYEANDENDPDLPKLILSDLSSNILNSVQGEKIVGSDSNTTALLVSNNGTNEIEFIYLNENSFINGETVTFKESNITAVVLSFVEGDRNIVDDFVLDPGQRSDYADYSFITRKEENSIPTKKLKIVFDHYVFEDNDDGDFVSVNSYDIARYKNDMVFVDGISGSDIIDVRPRVSPYDPSSATSSPFEFDARNFQSQTNSSPHLFAKDKNLNISYYYYVGRIDKLFLTKDGKFVINSGVPSLDPKTPNTLDNALEVATIKLPPYVYNIKNVIINNVSHKRFRMKDIQSLENRIKNVEYYTSLSLLESETKSLTIKDTTTGLDKFKCGFFVDNFKSALSGNLSDPSYKCSIDTANGILRPQHYTTSLDLLLGSEAIVGVASTSNPTADYNYVSNLGSPNVVKKGKTVTLKYSHVVYVENKFATRVENVNPFHVVNWIGDITLDPESDTWIETSTVEKVKNIEGNYNDTIEQYSIDTNTGLSPIEWGAWETTWTGEKVTNTQSMGSLLVGSKVTDTNTQKGSYVSGKGIPITTKTTIQDQYTKFTNVTTEKTTQQTAKGIQYKVSEKWDEIPLGPSVVSTDTILTLRSRNIEFIAKRMKPNTQVYPFFDNVDMSKYIIPKLLEIKMVSGTFQLGETVTGTSGSVSISLRLAKADHKYGPYNSPDEKFTQNPYNTSENVSTSYSTTSTLLNVDTASLQLQTASGFYGYVVKNMKLTGKSSGAVATISNVRLITDKAGSVLGSLFIPDSKLPSNPKFETGPKTFTLTSSKTNSTVVGTVGSSADGKFTSAGTLNNVEDVTLKIKNAKVEKTTLSKEQTLTESSTSLVANTTFKTKVKTQTKWVDPLAQSFEVVDANGVYITKCDVYFKTKDTNELPITMQIRTMQTGLPTTTIVPFGEIVLSPSKVKISDDGSVPTTFTFPSPVYLDPGQAYCVVLLSASNAYTVYISRMGEEDISTINKAESEKILVSQQPLLGSLFKSQNGATWDPSQLEDLKMKLYRAKFYKGSSTVRFYNPQLDIGNKQVATLKQNPIRCLSNRVLVGTAKSFTSTEQSNLTPGITILQENNPNFSAKLDNVLGSIGVSSELTITNPGFGFTDSSRTYSNVSLVSLTGRGSGAKVNITIDGSVAVAATVSVGGTGYSFGDSLRVNYSETSGLGRNLILSIPENVGVISAFNSLILDRVQGQVNQDAVSELIYVGTSGTTLLTNATVNYIENLADGLHFKVTHRNHGMYSINDFVTISSIESNIKPRTLNANYSASSTANIGVSAVGIFTSFENLPISALNPGYVLIDDEIIRYTGINTSAKTLTGITRGIDSTTPTLHTKSDAVFKYELNGVSLRRINKTHSFGFTDYNTYPADTDYYWIKVDMSANGTDRTTGNANSFPELHFNQDKTCGSYNPLALIQSNKTPKATQNIPFNIIRPNIGTLIPPETSIDAKIRTFSGSSPDNNSQTAFIDQGFESVSLTSNNYLTTPRIICSQVNENQYLTSYPGKKSFTMEFTLSTDDDKVSPMIDLERVNVITTSNRINSKVSDYSTDSRVNSLLFDPSIASYVTKIVKLEKSSDNLKVLFDAYRHSSNDIRVMYRLFRSDSDPSKQLYELFPGYDNLDENDEVIDPANNNGRPDKIVVPSTTITDLGSYEFTANNLPLFNGFQVKIIMTGTNTSYVPQIENLRVIATV